MKPKRADGATRQVIKKPKAFPSFFKRRRNRSEKKKMMKKKKKLVHTAVKMYKSPQKLVPMMARKIKECLEKQGAALDE